MDPSQQPNPIPSSTTWPPSPCISWASLTVAKRAARRRARNESITVGVMAPWVSRGLLPQDNRTKRYQAVIESVYVGPGSFTTILTCIYHIWRNQLEHAGPIRQNTLCSVYVLDLMQSSNVSLEVLKSRSFTFVQKNSWSHEEKKGCKDLSIPFAAISRSSGKKNTSNSWGQVSWPQGWAWIQGCIQQQCTKLQKLLYHLSRTLRNWTRHHWKPHGIRKVNQRLPRGAKLWQHLVVTCGNSNPTRHIFQGPRSNSTCLGSTKKWKSCKVSLVNQPFLSHASGWLNKIIYNKTWKSVEKSWNYIRFQDHLGDKLDLLITQKFIDLLLESLEVVSFKISSLRVSWYHPPCHSMSPSEPSVTLGGVASASTRKLGCVTRTCSRACLVIRPCKCCQRQEEMKRTPSYRVTSRSWRLQLEVKQENAP